MGSYPSRRLSVTVLIVLFIFFIFVPAFLTPAADANLVPAASPDLGLGSVDVRGRLHALGVAGSLPQASPELWNALLAFYQARQHRPAWVQGDRLTQEAGALMRAVSQVERDGMDPSLYALSRTGARLAWATAQAPGLAGDEAADTDVRLTLAFLKFAGHMLHGRFQGRGVSTLWALETQPADLGVLLARAASGRVAEVLRELVPQHPQYAGLRQELALHRAISRDGGWPTVPSGPALRPGQRSPRVAVLRDRLSSGRDLVTAKPPVEGADFFDPALALALKAFEARHGLKADGVLDKTALAALNVPVEDRIQQIELNLERWRWLPRELGPRHVLVNIPTFELQAFQDGRRALHMRVVTGKAGDSPTPVFSQTMTHLVFSPYWNVPPGIAEDETRPAVLRNRGYLRRHNLEVVRGARVVDPALVDLSHPDIQFRQRPGSRNALGQVKFLMPNRFSVYLHDTPSRSLFARVRRDFSHGCVRLEKPFEMARFVLEGTGWTPQGIQAAMRAGKEKHVRLEAPLPVYITYFTVWMDDEGVAHYRSDLYRHDAAQAPLLPNGASAPLLKVAQSAPRAAASF